MLRSFVFLASGLIAFALNSAAGASDLPPARETQTVQETGSAPRAWEDTADPSSTPNEQRRARVTATPVPAWDGTYVGDHLGGAWSDFAVTGSGTGIGSDNRNSSVIGGLQVGFNRQRRALVYGVEMDVGGISLGRTARFPASNQVSSTIESGFYADLTARLGYSYRSILWYAKGGFALFDGSTTITGGNAETAQASGSVGWTVGSGIEFKFNPAWSAKLEYQHFDFGAASAQLAAGMARYRSSLTADAVMTGINFHLRTPK